MVLNRRMKELREQVQSGAISGNKAGSEEAMEAIAETLSELEENIGEMRLEFTELKERSASSEELKELKFVIDSINPLEYVTLDQVKQMIDDRAGKKAGKNKK